MVRLEIQNGTTITGYAFMTSQVLGGQGFEIVSIGNAEERAHEQTIVYDLTNGEQPDELALIQEYLAAYIYTEEEGWIYADEVEAREITLEPENPLLSTSEENIDFLIILGEASADLVMR